MTIAYLSVNVFSIKSADYFTADYQYYENAGYAQKNLKIEKKKFKESL